MADNLQDPKQFKIFPRNLTARADYIVRGNPASTRPESGVDNCYPGLEFDQRNLDKAFFPGLAFEFHRQEGAILHRVMPGSVPAQAGLTSNDFPVNRPLYLWALVGQTAGDPVLFSFDGGLSGLEVWRRVHDLQPSRIAILLGPRTGLVNGFPQNSINLLINQYNGNGNFNPIVRAGGLISFAAFADDRTQYLDEDGIIDISVYPPGELTRTLCIPWQFDFRDCGCFYWAANKPDVVTSADNQQPYVNFMRKDRQSNPPPPDVLLDDERSAQEFGYEDLINGAWNELAVVLNDRETEQFTPVEPVVPVLMNRAQVIEELTYLATVEHALCVEYLYAHYSLNAPMKLPEGDVADSTRRIFAAANEIFSIAVDEMRHLRWVNEALDLLGQPPSLGRAERIGRQLDRPFELKPLTPDQLQWFIDVEEPSQVLGGMIDGMYVRLHTSVDRQPEIFPERERLVHLFKLIIDEGEDHYQRFSSIQQHLAGLTPAQYLRTFQEPAPGTVTASLQQLCNQNYQVLLGSLAITLALSDRASGILLQQSRRAMFNLHEVAHHLAGKGVGVPFTLPPPAPALATPDEAHAHVDFLAAAVNEALTAVAASGDAAEQALVERQRTVHDQLFEQMRQLINTDLEQ